MYFFHEDMAKNIFIMTVPLTLKCGYVKSFVKGPLRQHVKQITDTNVDYVDSRRAVISGERNVYKELVTMPLGGFWCKIDD